jgi:predicted Zn finger-like uncharacterized protein
MRFVCESCRAQYMINDEKVGPKGVKVRCRKCGYVILVKRADAAKASGPVAQSNDPDDALATQVMQTPLAAAEATLSNEDTSAAAAEEMTNPGTNTSGPTLPSVDPLAPGGPKDSFFGADEDEIGAVFDQVLKTGNHSIHKSDELGSPDDRQSTRVIDADTVRKLAEESGSSDKPAPETKAEEIPTTDWYVAINEKQTGPLTLEKVKEHWDRGEISPDSLCWRAGYDDWLPVSEVKMLNSVLAPKPPKPIVVAPAATITQGGPSIVSVPVQSAFSAGGMMQTVQSEMQVPMSAGGHSSPEETGGWKPSAANALASLVKDEMDALSRPPPKAQPPPVDEPQQHGGGLLDLPHEEKATNGATVMPMPVERQQDRPARPAPPPPNPYLQNPGATYSAPAMTQYRPPNNRNLMIGVAAGGGVMLLILVGLIVWLATRTPPQQQMVMAPTPTPVVAQPTPTPVPVAVTPTPVPVAVTPTPTPVPVAVTPTPTPVPVAVSPPTPVQPKVSRPKQGTGGTATTVARVEKEPVAAPEPKEPKRAASSGGGEDDFDSAFGPSKKTAAKDEPKPEKKQPGYIPPAPGGAVVEIKESLGQSDIMEVVLANKGALTKCVEEQRKKDPGNSGKLLMKWTIQTSGKTSNVGVVSDEFKGAPIAGCVGSLIKGMTFPRHKVQGDPITFPFKF